MRLVTLTTDIGSAYAAQMKGVLLTRLPPGSVVDLSLDLDPFRVEEAAFLLDHMGRTFPPGTVHLAVVDPGVGSPRRALAVECPDGTMLIGPDNGILDRLALRKGIRRAVEIAPAAPGDRVGATFEGRDRFAPAAVRLALGEPVRRVGRPCEYRPNSAAPPRRTPSGGVGHVEHVDRFGNLVTDLPSDWWSPEAAGCRVVLGAGRPRKLRPVRAYGELDRTDLGLLPSSFGTLEIACREGSAARKLGARVGDQLVLESRAPRRAPRKDRK